MGNFASQDPVDGSDEEVCGSVIFVKPHTKCDIRLVGRAAGSSSVGHADLFKNVGSGDGKGRRRRVGRWVDRSSENRSR